MNESLGSQDLLEMAWSASDMNKDVYICRSEVDDEIIMYVTIDGEETWNDLYREEMDNSDAAEARRYYYG